MQVKSAWSTEIWEQYARNSASRRRWFRRSLLKRTATKCAWKMTWWHVLQCTLPYHMAVKDPLYIFIHPLKSCRPLEEDLEVPKPRDHHHSSWRSDTDTVDNFWQFWPKKTAMTLQHSWRAHWAPRALQHQSPFKWSVDPQKVYRNGCWNNVGHFFDMCFFIASNVKRFRFVCLLAKAQRDTSATDQLTKQITSDCVLCFSQLGLKMESWNVQTDLLKGN